MKPGPPPGAYTVSCNSDAALAALRHRIITGRYRVAPELVAERMVSDAGVVRWARDLLSSTDFAGSTSSRVHVLG